MLPNITRLLTPLLFLLITFLDLSQEFPCYWECSVVGCEVSVLSVAIRRKLNCLPCGVWCRSSTSAAHQLLLSYLSALHHCRPPPTLDNRNLVSSSNFLHPLIFTNMCKSSLHRYDDDELSMINISFKSSDHDVYGKLLSTENVHFAV